jgi:hypothetical protein
VKRLSKRGVIHESPVTAFRKHPDPNNGHTLEILLEERSSYCDEGNIHLRV